MSFIYLQNINPSKISAILSIIVAIIILVSNFFQWWNITYDGTMITKKWVKIVFVISIVVLIISGILVLI